MRPRGHTPNLRFLLLLTVLALLTRLVWVLWIHPPGDYVFSDMGQYVERARRLVLNGFEPGSRELAWQVWGTHVLLALPLRLFGLDDLTAAAVMWGLMGAAAVPLAYLLACRLCRYAGTAYAVGVILLLWHPNLSNTGYFLSETPFLLFQLAATYGLVVVWQDGRGAWPTGIACAIAFAVRPQIAIFFVAVLLLWILHRRRLPHVGVRQLVGVSLPILLMLLFSLWRFHAHTGYWGGIAENANMNSTAGRCHNIVTQAFKTQAQLRHSERRDNTRDGRRVGLPQYRRLAQVLPENHPFALRPALGSETIRFVGYIGDPEVHRQIRQRCVAATGWVEQVRYSVVNASLLWFFGRQWPELERGHRVFLRYVEVYKYIFVWVFWLPSLVGVGWAVAGLRRRPEWTMLGIQILVSIGVAAAFFGTIRLRTPYDPYSILLAAEVATLAGVAILNYVRRRARAPEADAPTA